MHGSFHVRHSLTYGCGFEMVWAEFCLPCEFDLTCGALRSDFPLAERRDYYFRLPLGVGLMRAWRWMSGPMGEI